MNSDIVYCERYGVNGSPVIYSKQGGPDDISRVKLDLTSVHKKDNYLHQVTNLLKEVFLPQGFPESVRDDYSSYQIWDTVQASCSTISGTMTTHAIMKGVGVGDSAATALSATITWIMKDGVGMVGRIAFAWWKGNGLDADCKKWRLCADFLNDAAMSLELLLLPLYPHSSTQILCVTSAMKAIVGVAGGASRAAITQHHAVRGNMGDVSAKDGSQETCVNLVTSMLGVIILSATEHSLILWMIFSFVTILHMYANYRAVKSLKLVTFNTQRLSIFLNSYLSTASAPSPKDVNNLESVIVGQGYSDEKLCGFKIKLGCSLQSVISLNLINSEDMNTLSQSFQSHPYLVILSMKNKTIYVALAPGENTQDVLLAYFHAILIGIATSFLKNIPIRILESTNADSKYSILYKLKEKSGKDVLQQVEVIVKDESQKLITDLKKEGWSTENHHLPVDEWRGMWNNLKENLQSKKNE